MIETDAQALGLTAFDRVYRAAAPWAFGLAWVAARLLGASPDELRSRAGMLPQACAPLLWFHGASAGEMSAAARLAQLLGEHGCRFSAGYTATNRAGLEYARNVGGTHALAALGPWDASRWLERAFDRWRPLALFLVETELWPGLVLAACRRKVPVFCVSGRIYPRDLPRYRAIRPFIAPTLRRLTAILAQNETERARFVELGAPDRRCFAAGNLKYLALDPERDSTGGSCRASFGVLPADRVLVFGSVHEDEIGLVFDVLDRLVRQPLRVIIAPRHRSAAPAVVREAARRGLSVGRRSQSGSLGSWQVLVLDTFGELRSAYSIATTAVIGGGFRDHGGHNPMEPLFGGTPVMFGPHFGHFEHEAAELARAAPEARVAGAGELSARLEQWLEDEERRRRVLALQRGVLPDGAEIAQRYLSLLLPRLEGSLL